MGSIGMSKIFNSIYTILQEGFQNLIESVYSAVSSMLMNGIMYSIIGLIVLFYLIKRLKGDFGSREENYKAVIWVATVCFIFAIMSNYNAYLGFLEILRIPVLYVTDVVVSVFNPNGNASNLGELLGGAWDKINTILVGTSDYGLNQATKDWSPGKVMINIFIHMITMLQMFIFWLIHSILFIGLGCIFIVSSILVNIILSLAPLVIPLLIIPQTRGYFFSWFKLVLSYAMYAPFGLLVLSFSSANIDKVIVGNNGLNEDTFQAFYEKTFDYILIPSLLALISIYLLTKIPNWINQILGTQNQESGGLGAVGSIVGAGMTAGGSFAGGALSGLISGKTMGGALKQGALNTIPGGKLIQNTMQEKKSAQMQEATLGALKAMEGYFK